MPTRNQQKKRPRKKVPAKRLSLARLWRFTLALFLLLVLFGSITVAGYVIFFGTAFARDIPVDLHEIIFEEPDPPEHFSVEGEPPPRLLGNLPKVAIIIDDMGYHKQLGEQLLGLPVVLNYSFLPFVPHSRVQAVQAHLAGRTVLLHLPLQPRNPAWNPGPGALLVDDTPPLRREKFVRCLAEIPHVSGVNNHMGSLFTEDSQAMTEVMGEIHANGLFFVDSYTTSASTGLQVAGELQVRSARRDVFLDNILDERQICLRLEELVEIALRRGWGIGIAHPHQVTVDALRRCAPSYQGQVEYVGVEEIIAGQP
jgi:polysaccharide deacetylase 2 family uncharacterized protein YibQ